MRTHFLILIAYLGFQTLWAQKDIYEIKNFDEIASQHKSIAILPFQTHLNLDEVAPGISVKELQEKESYAVQNALETYFLKRKNKKKFVVEFQDISKTNALLKRNDINFEKLDIYTPHELAELLKVDAIISGTLTLRTLISQEVDESFNFMDFLEGKSDFGRISIKISDGQNGRLLWKYGFTINRKSGRNTEDIIDKMMRKATRKFPYERDN